MYSNICTSDLDRTENLTDCVESGENPGTGEWHNTDSQKSN